MRVALVDDDKIVRESLARVLGAVDYIELSWIAGSGQEAIDICVAEQELPADQRVQVLVTDLQMPGVDGITLIRRLTALPDSPKIVVLSSFAQLDYITEAFRAGASGYFAKDDDSSLIADNLLKVAGGELAFSPTCSEEVAQMLCQARRSYTDFQSHAVGLLTDRELEVLQLAADSFSNREIARKLGLSEQTVKVHFRAIFPKLGVADRAGAVAFGIRHGLID